MEIELKSNFRILHFNGEIKNHTIQTQVATYVAQSGRLCYIGRKLAVDATNIG